MMAPGKKERSVGFIVYKRGKEPSVLVRSKVPKGTFQRPPFLAIDDVAMPDQRAREGVEELGLGAFGDGPCSLGMKMVYFAREVRHDEHLFMLEAPQDLKAPKGYRWVTPRKALDSFLLSGHKRGVAMVYPELLPDGLRSLDHVPVKHPGQVVVICDFDGTVSEPEASLAILRKFAPGRWERYEKPWLDKEISTHDCLGYQFTLLDASVEEMARFAADNIALREGFEDLVEVCKRFGYGLVISSCGVDFYIKAILERHDLGDVSFVAIRTHWVEGLGHIAEEGFFNPECDWCGNCKRDLVSLYRSRGAMVAYVGDGATDECAAERADIVFARAGLMDFCKEKKIKDCRPFETFKDVLRWLDERD